MGFRMVSKGNSRSEGIIRTAQQQNRQFKDLGQFYDWWTQNQLQSEEIKDDGIKNYCADVFLQCLRAGVPLTPDPALLALLIPILRVLAHVAKWLMDRLFPKDKEIVAQAVIGFDMDPRGLSDEVRAELGRAADRPTGWGIPDDVWECWGERHGLKRIRQTPTGPEVVYDNF